MPNVGVSLSPQGPGILAMRHRGFEDDSPSWDLDKRAALLGFEITGRDDATGPDSIGHWKEDPDTRGDINCANYWQADYEKRPVGCWSFGYASLISKSSGGSGGGGAGGNQGGRPNVATGGGAGGGGGDGPGNTQAGGSGSIEVLPVGSGAAPDERFNPKSPLTLQPEGAAQGDPKSPAAQGAAGPNGNGGAPGAPGGPGAPGAGGPGAGGGGVDSLSGFNGGYFGGGLGFGFNPLEGTGIGGLSRGQTAGVSFSFGGNSSLAALSGIAGVGTGGGFAQFQGVRNFFAGSGGGVGFTFRFPGQRR